MILEVVVSAAVAGLIFAHAYFSSRPDSEPEAEYLPLFFRETSLSESDEDSLRNVLVESKRLSVRSKALEKPLSSKEAPSVSPEKEEVQRQRREEEEAASPKAEKAPTEPPNAASLFLETINSVESTRRILSIARQFRQNLSREAQKAILAALFDLAESKNEPSVVSDLSNRDYENVFDVLKTVTLAEHTLHVTERIVRELAELPGLSSKLAEPYLLAAIFHDIGKLKKFRERFLETKKYRLLDHPQISRRVFEEYYSLTDERVSEAIELHHKPIQTAENPILQALKKSDQEARRIELEEKSQNLPKLNEVLEKSEVVSAFLDYYTALKVDEKMSISDLSSPIIFSSGFFFVQRQTLREIFELLLRRKKKIAREQILGEKEFEIACLDFLVENGLTTQEIVSSKIFVEKQYGKRIRRHWLRDYIALPIEKLSVYESSLSEIEPKSKFKRVVFEPIAASG